MKRQKRQKIEETVVEARREKKWLDKFNTGRFKECPSVGLKLSVNPRFINRLSSAVVPEASSSAVATVAPSISATEESSSVISSSARGIIYSSTKGIGAD